MFLHEPPTCQGRALAAAVFFQLPYLLVVRKIDGSRDTPLPPFLAPMTARDIIPGSPRGRTTSGGPLCLQAWHYFLFCTSSPEMAEQIELERAYHAGQQAMVNHFFETSPQSPSEF